MCYHQNRISLQVKDAKLGSRNERIEKGVSGRGLLKKTLIGLCAVGGTVGVANEIAAGVVGSGQEIW